MLFIFCIKSFQKSAGLLSFCGRLVNIKYIFIGGFSMDEIEQKRKDVFSRSIYWLCCKLYYKLENVGDYLLVLTESFLLKIRSSYALWKLTRGNVVLTLYVGFFCVCDVLVFCLMFKPWRKLNAFCRQIAQWSANYT